MNETETACNPNPPFQIASFGRKNPRSDVKGARGKRNSKKWLKNGDPLAASNRQIAVVRGFSRSQAGVGHLLGDSPPLKSEHGRPVISDTSGLRTAGKADACLPACLQSALVRALSTALCLSGGKRTTSAVRTLGRRMKQKRVFLFLFLKGGSVRACTNVRARAPRGTRRKQACSGATYAICAR